MQRQDHTTAGAQTVNAAAIVLAAARTTTTSLLQQQQQLDDHASCNAATKTRWWSRLKAKLLCFRPHGRPQRIADASPEPGATTDHTAASYHAPRPALAFVAPPSSPASSVLTSESPSPVVLLNASSSYSSPTVSIFAIGPYAREPQQLVSPPAFSAGPSTAPLTPPPESTCSLHLATTPSSPEVPFARFLSPSVDGTDGFFHAYQLQPGSPVGGSLVSPGSASSSPPSWKMQNNGGRIPIPEREEVGKSGGEFVFGNADAGGEVGGGGSLALGDATATEQWPFFLAQGRR